MPSILSGIIFNGKEANLTHFSLRLARSDWPKLLRVMLSMQHHNKHLLQLQGPSAPPHGQWPMLARSNNAGLPTVLFALGLPGVFVGLPSRVLLLREGPQLLSALQRG